MSARRRRAAGVVLAGWALAAPASLWAMSNPQLGHEEHQEVRALFTGASARAIGRFDPVEGLKPLARYLDGGPLRNDQRVVVDAFRGSSIATQVHPDHLRGSLVLTSDTTFKGAIADPRRHRVSYFLLPDPEIWPEDAIVRARPRLWAGREPGFELVRSFPAGGQLPETWRLYAVRPGVRPLSKALLASL